MKLNCHVSMSTPDYVLGSVKKVIGYGTNTFMLYIGAPQSTRRKAIHELRIEETHSLMKEYGIDEGSMIVHAPYIINLADCIWGETFAPSVEFLQKEIARVQALYATVLMLRLRGHMEVGEEKGLKKIVEGLDLIIQDVQDVQILIGTMVDKGNEIGYSFIHVRYLMDHAKCSDRLRVCLGACHIHDTGYDLLDFDKVLDELDAAVGLERLACIYINDSKNVQGICEDRHVNIGFGGTGFKKLNAIVYNERVKDIVEIPGVSYIEDRPPYRQEIAILRNGVFDKQIMGKIEGDI